MMMTMIENYIFDFLSLENELEKTWNNVVYSKILLVSLAKIKVLSSLIVYNSRHAGPSTEKL